MIDDAKIILDNTIDIENQTTPFGKRYGGDVFVNTVGICHGKSLRNDKIIGLDVQNEYISYLKYKAK